MSSRGIGSITAYSTNKSGTAFVLCKGAEGMVVTNLEQSEQSKVKVFIDDSYAFLLYQKDIEQFGLKQGREIAEALYMEIMEETIYRRAKQKALAVLKFIDRTEQELRTKLSESGYPEEIIIRTISYVMEYGYLNDERFARAYIRARMHTKSKQVIKNELYRKGISKEVADSILAEEYENTETVEDAELSAIRKAVAKKTKNPEALNPQEKQKLMASLYRKGFEISKIKKVILDIS
jgi:Uncharacterized protein conserved in bacteria